jgi:tetratricopeptide (TPR) repeat protein
MRADTRTTTLVLAAVIAGAVAASAQAAPAENSAAKAAFVEGERNFQLGKFEAAIDAYERAFGLDAQPAFLFNIALAHRRQFEIDGRVEHLARARELYRNYLKLEPQSGNRAGVEKLIGELTARIEQERSKPAPSPAPSPAAAPGPPGAAEAAAPPAPAPPASSPPPAAPPAALLSAPAGDNQPAASSNRKWVIGGTIAAAAVVAAIAVLFIVTREGATFDGPGVTLR